MRECRVDSNCDDGNGCTQDFCTVQGCCENTAECSGAADCDDGDPCTVDACTETGCCEYYPECTSNADCDDNDACTLDTCTLDGCCTHEPTQDDDADGVANDCDACPNTPPGVGVDSEGRPLGDLDGDCDTDLRDLQPFLSGAPDLATYLLFYESLTGPLP
jgi:hypothetical protein